MLDVISVILAIAGVYAGIGFVFAIAFVAKGVEQIDHNARGTSFGFRLLILPGSVAFWPMLLRRWISRASPPQERNAHRDAAERVTE